MPLPDFFVVGAGRSGTTSFCAYLAQHPEIFFSPVKEPHFYYLRDLDRTPQGPGAQAWLSTCTKSREEYLALFEGSGAARAAGEGSVTYLSAPGVPAAIRADVPDARLIVLLRAPVARAFAAFLGHRLNGREPCSDFADALTQEPTRAAAGWPFGGYFEDGLYGKHLRSYLRHFDRSQICVLFFENFVQDPAATVREAFAHLGVSPGFEPDLSVVLNRTGVLRNPVARFLWARSFSVRARLRPHLPETLRHAAFRIVSTTGFEKPRIPEDTRRRLALAYREDIASLEEILGRDLQHWL